MKVIKKIIKIFAILGVLFGFAKLVCEFCKTTIKMNGYNSKNVFTGNELNYDEEAFEKDSVASLFSGVELNFEKATMKDKTSILDIFGRFSGIEVTVPNNWKVVLDGKEKASGIENNVEEIDDENAPVLNINYDLAFCGLEVSNSKDKITKDFIEEKDQAEDIIEEVIEDEEIIGEVIEDDLLGEEDILEEVIEEIEVNEIDEDTL